MQNNKKKKRGYSFLLSFVKLVCLSQKNYFKKKQVFFIFYNLSIGLKKKRKEPFDFIRPIAFQSKQTNKK